MSSRFTIDTRKAIGDINKYSTDTQRLIRAEMDTQAWTLSGEQEKFLYKRVKAKPPILTNNLGSSIGVTSRDKNNWYVGPDEKKVVYAWYIEEGAAASQRARGNTFSGYGYVKYTFRPMKKRITNALRKIISRKVL